MLAVKVTSHFGQRTSVVLMRRSSAGGIRYPHCGQGVASDAFTFSRLIFFRAGIRRSVSAFPLLTLDMRSEPVKFRLIHAERRQDIDSIMTDLLG